jgi:hypothetical protein
MRIVLNLRWPQLSNEDKLMRRVSATPPQSLQYVLTEIARMGANFLTTDGHG